MVYNDMSNLIKSNNRNIVVLSSLWQTYVKAEQIIRLCTNIGLNIEGSINNKPTFSDLYSIQSNAIDGFIALSNINIDDTNIYETMTNMMSHLYHKYEDHEIFDNEMLNECETKYGIIFN